MKKILLFLIMAIVFFGCPDVSETPSMPDADLAVEEPVDSVFYFKFSVVPNFIQPGNQAYVFLHDIDGELVKYSEIKNGEEYLWEIESNSPHHLTICNTGTYSNNSTYTNVKTRTSMPIDQPLVVLGSHLEDKISAKRIGEVDIKVTNGPPLYSMHLSNGFGSFPLGSYNLKNTTSTGTFPKYEGPKEYLLVATDRAGVTKYKMIPDIESLNSYTFEYDQFEDFEYTIPIDVSKYDIIDVSVKSINTSGTKLSNSFYSTFIFPVNPINFDSINLGYLSGFPYYKTSIYAYDGPGEPIVGYQSFLKTPKAIKLPDPEPAELLDKTMRHFKFEKIGGTDFSHSLWYYKGKNKPENSHISWTIVTDSNENPVLEFTSDITDQLPFLQDIEGFELEQLIQFESSISYTDYLKWEFVQNTTLPLDIELHLYLSSYGKYANSRKIRPSLLDPLSFFEPLGIVENEFMHFKSPEGFLEEAKQKSND